MSRTSSSSEERGKRFTRIPLFWGEGLLPVEAILRESSFFVCLLRFSYVYAGAQTRRMPEEVSRRVKLPLLSLGKGTSSKQKSRFFVRRKLLYGNAGTSQRGKQTIGDVAVGFRQNGLDAHGLSILLELLGTVHR
jgi:hypothetical protein